VADENEELREYLKMLSVYTQAPVLEREFATSPQEAKALGTVSREDVYTQTPVLEREFATRPQTPTPRRPVSREDVYTQAPVLEREFAEEEPLVPVPAPSAPDDRVSPSPGPTEAAAGVQVSEQPVEPEPSASFLDTAKTVAKYSTLPMAVVAGPPGMGVWTSTFMGEEPEEPEAEKAVPIVFDGANSKQPSITVEPVLFESAIDTEDETLFKIRTGVTAEGPGGGIRYGEVGIDANATAERLAKARAAQIAQTDPAYAQGITKEQANRLYLQELTKAKSDVSAWYDEQTRQGADLKPLVSFGLTPGAENLKSWAEGMSLEDKNAPFYKLMSFIPEGEAREIVAPFFALYEGAELTSRTGTGIRTYNEDPGLNWGFLSWAGRFSPGTLGANYVAVDEQMDWGGPEMMRNIARGEDLFTLFDKIEAKAYDSDANPLQRLLGGTLLATSGLVEGSVGLLDGAAELAGMDLATPEGAEAFGDFIVAAGLTMFDPDLWWGVGGSIAKGASRGARAAAKVIPWFHVNQGGAAMESALAKWRKAQTQFSRDGDRKALQRAQESILKDIRLEAGPGAESQTRAMYSAMTGNNNLPSAVTEQALYNLDNNFARRAAAMDASEQSREAWQKASRELASLEEAAAAQGLKVDRKAVSEILSSHKETRTRFNARKSSIEAKIKTIDEAIAAGADSPELLRRQTALNKTLDAVNQAIATKDQQVELYQRVDTLRKQKSRAKAGVLSQQRSAKLQWMQSLDELMFARVLRADIQSTIDSVRALTLAGRKAKAGMDPDDIAQRLEQSARNLATNPAFRDDDIARATAVAQHNELLSEAATAANDAVVTRLSEVAKSLDDKIEGLNTKVDEAREALGSWAPKMDRASAPAKGTQAREIYELERSHKKLTKALERQILKNTDMRAMAAFDATLSRMSETYKAVQKQGIGLMSEVPASAAMIRSIQRLNEEFADADVRSVRQYLNKGRLILREFAEPVRQITGSSDAQMNNIYSRQNNLYNQAQIDLKEVLRKTEDPTKTPQELRVSRTKAISDYLDDTQGKYLSTNSFPESAFGAARNFIRLEEQFVGTKAGEKVMRKDDRLLTSLSRMWLINADRDLTERESARLIRIAREWFEKPTLGPGSRFEDFAETMLSATERILKTPGGAAGRRAAAGSRAYGKAAQAITAAATMERTIEAVAKTVTFPADLDISLVKAWSENDPAAMGRNFENVLKAMDNLGVPPKVQKEAQEAAEALAGGISVFKVKSPDGKLVALPTRWVRLTAKKISATVNSLDQYTAAEKNPVNRRAGQILRDMWKLWQASVLTGVLLPDPKYTAMILAGNPGQIYIRSGLVSATKAGIRGAFDVSASGLKHLPFVGETLDAKFGAYLKDGLPSPLGSYISTQVSAVFDLENFPKNQVWGQLDGKDVTYGQLREMMVSEGVFSSFVSAAGVRDIVARTLPGRLQQMPKRWADGIQSFNQHIEERMRVGYFLDRLVNEGDSPQEAGRLVRDALYDWDSKLSRFEETWLRDLFLFWPFTRRALDNMAARVSRYNRVADGFEKSVDKYLEEEYSYSPSNYPLWASEVTSRMYFGMSQLDPDLAAKRNVYGKPVTHVMYSFPAATHHGSAQLVGRFYRTLAAMTKADQQGAVKEGLGLAGSMVGPMSQYTVDALKEAFGEESTSFVEKHCSMACTIGCRGSWGQTSTKWASGRMFPNRLTTSTGWPRRCRWIWRES
jgi:hypothetical protein